MIGANIHIKGELSGEDDLVVEGHVEGKINLRKNLVIGKTGNLQADIHAKMVTISGRVVGNVSADEKVELMASGFLEGNIKAPKIVIAEGAHFRGNVEMSAAKPEGAASAGATSPAVPASPVGPGALAAVGAKPPQSVFDSKADGNATTPSMKTGVK